MGSSPPILVNPPGPIFHADSADTDLQVAAACESIPLLVTAGFKTFCIQFYPDAFAVPDKLAKVRAVAGQAGATVAFGTKVAWAFDLVRYGNLDDSRPFDASQLCDWRGWRRLLAMFDPLGGIDEYVFLDWERALMHTALASDPFWSPAQNVVDVAELIGMFMDKLLNDLGPATVNYDLFVGGYAPHSIVCGTIQAMLPRARTCYLAAGPGYRADGNPLATLKVNPPNTRAGYWIGRAPAWNPADLARRRLITSQAWVAGSFLLRDGWTQTDAQRFATIKTDAVVG